MLNRTHNSQAARPAQPGTAPRRRPGSRVVPPAAPGAPRVGGGAHALVRGDDNARLFDYEQRVKAAFDAIVPALRRISALQHEEDFERQAQAVARERLGFELPEWILRDAWVDQLDMRRLYAWCVFETYLRFSDDFFSADPLGWTDAGEFQSFLQECGFHILDISPCADGRLAHVIRYVLRLPYRTVRRKSYAGALFDIEDSLEKWGETELLRFREGVPNTADAPTRYLKAVVYHYSSSAPDTEGCAAHGSDAVRAAEAGRERLLAFQQAVENSYCCGASIDLLLIGLDTDTDAIRLHLPTAEGGIEPGAWVDAAQLYDETRGLHARDAGERIDARLREAAPQAPAGMLRLLARLLENNLSQIEYVQRHYGGRYPDIGHAERFIGAGKGFEEVQLRNLTYFAYLDTVEEAAPDLDVGVKIFSRLNVGHGLPIPVVVRFDYHGKVPAARERAVEHCRRVAGALAARYPELAAGGLLHTLQLVRDIDQEAGAGGRVEVLDCSVREPVQEAH